MGFFTLLQHNQLFHYYYEGHYLYCRFLVIGIPGCLYFDLDLIGTLFQALIDSHFPGSLVDGDLLVAGCLNVCFAALACIGEGHDLGHSQSLRFLLYGFELDSRGPSLNIQSVGCLVYSELDHLRAAVLAALESHLDRGRIGACFDIV